MVNVSFVELAHAVRRQAIAATDDCSQSLSDAFYVHEGWTRRSLFALFLSLAALVARHVYDDVVVRGLLRAVMVGHDRWSPMAPHEVSDFEQVFLSGANEDKGLRRVSAYLARYLGRERVLTYATASEDLAIEQLVALVFGAGSTRDEEGFGGERHVAEESAHILVHDASACLASLKQSFSSIGVESLVANPLRLDALNDPAHIRVVCALPERDDALLRLGSGFRISYEIQAYDRSMLSVGTETHIAPQGPSQAIERAFSYLRNRWYPQARVMIVTSVDELPPSDFTGLYRHFSVAGPAMSLPGRALAPRMDNRLVVGRTREEAMMNLSRSTGFSTSGLVERPLYVSGRRGRAALTERRYSKLMQS